MTNTIAIQTPIAPSGRKPPCAVRLDRPNAGAGPHPKIRANPKARNKRIATTLIIENQYSNAPKLATLRALTHSRATEKPTIQTHFGLPGNHHWQKMEIATAPPPMATHWHAQYVYRMTKPAQGLM